MALLTKTNMTTPTIHPPKGKLWIFAYGSLMWSPGFPIQRTTTAQLHGYHRRLCLWSVHYRGTPNHPGLVLGLDRGGSCLGIALQVAPGKEKQTITYLLQREMINNPYLPRFKTIHLRHNNKKIQALTFISKPNHPQFAPKLNLTDTLNIIQHATGKTGTNHDYILNTAHHLQQHRIPHPHLQTLATHLKQINQ